MTNHEKLIEEAAKAIYFRADEIGINREVGQKQAEALARAALAVFEKAHTPTDDEREALETIIAVTWRDMYSTPTDRDFADAILAAGFRRSEVPEPSADMIASEDGMTLEELGNAMLSASDQWDGDESMHSIVYRFIEHYAELDAEIHAAREAVDFEDDVEILFRWDWESGALKRAESPEPQGEPSLAEIEAAGRALLPLLDPTWPYADYEEIAQRWLPGPRDEFHRAIRAALRAAAGVR